MKDVVIATEESYIRYNASLQVYYLFILAKLVHIGSSLGIYYCDACHLSGVSGSCCVLLWGVCVGF